jgi:hypothetical protein
MTVCLIRQQAESVEPNRRKPNVIMALIPEGPHRTFGISLHLHYSNRTS